MIEIEYLCCNKEEVQIMVLHAGRRPCTLRPPVVYNPLHLEYIWLLFNSLPGELAKADVKSGRVGGGSPSDMAQLQGTVQTWT